MDSNEGCGGAGDEDSELVKKVVKRVEFAVGGERWVVRVISRDGKEKSRRDALIYGVFGDINEEEWKHVR